MHELAPLRENVAVLLAQFNEIRQVPSQDEGLASEHGLHERCRMALSRKSQLNMDCSDLEVAVAGARAQRLLLQRKQLALSQRFLETSDDVQHLTLQHLKQKAAEELRTVALSAELRRLSDELCEIRACAGDQERHCRASAEVVDESLLAEAQRLESACTSEFSKQEAAASRNLQTFRTQALIANEESISRLRASTEQNLRFEEDNIIRSLNSIRDEASSEVAISAKRNVELQMAIQVLQDRVASAASELARGRREQRWLTAQFSELQDANGTLHLAESELRLSELPRLELEVQRQQADMLRLSQVYERAQDAAAEQRAQISDELQEAKREHAAALCHSAAHLLDLASSNLQGSSNVREAHCGISGNSNGLPYVGIESAQNTLRSDRNGATQDQLLFSGDEGTLTIPPTPSDLSPTTKSQGMRFTGTLDGLDLQGLFEEANELVNFIGGAGAGVPAGAAAAVAHAEDDPTFRQLASDLHSELEAARQLQLQSAHLAFRVCADHQPSQPTGDLSDPRNLHQLAAQLDVEVSGSWTSTTASGRSSRAPGPSSGRRPCPRPTSLRPTN